MENVFFLPLSHPEYSPGFGIWAAFLYSLDMQILVAPDKFKGSLTAIQACIAIRAGILKAWPSAEISLCPLADGGDGSLDVLAAQQPSTWHQARVRDPLGRAIQASYLLSGRIAFIEMARASGIALLQEKERNPLKTSTFGTGQLILEALAKKVREIVLFVGGSATNDAGMGIAQALGFRFLNKNEDEISPCGGNLEKIDRILSPDLSRLPPIRILTDVGNPFLGPNGAAYVYGPQKGASPEQVRYLDKGLQQMESLIQKQFGRDIAKIPGSGAAGGLAGGLAGLLGAEVKNGFDFIADWVGLDEKIRQTNLIITGEGKFDQQSLQGKVVGEVLKRARKHQKPILLLCGRSEFSREEVQQMGIHEQGELIKLSSNNPREAIQDAEAYLQNLSEAMLLNYK